MIVVKRAKVSLEASFDQAMLSLRPLCHLDVKQVTNLLGLSFEETMIDPMPHTKGQKHGPFGCEEIFCRCFLFGEVSSSSGCLGWATLFYCGTP